MGLDRLALVEAGVNAAGGVVDHVDQGHGLAAALDRSHAARYPFAPTRRSGASLPSLAVGVTALSRLPQTGSNEPLPQGLQADIQAAFGKFLACQSGSEVKEMVAILLEDAQLEFSVGLSIGCSATQAVYDGAVTALAERCHRRRTCRAVILSRRAASA